MEEKSLLAELTRNGEKNWKKLNELIAVYEMAKIGEQLQEERCKEIHNRVLKDNEFFISRDFSHVRDASWKVGDRILDDNNSFLMSEEDFERYQKLSVEIMAKEGITDSEGYYIEQWTTTCVKARHELIDFILNEIVPEVLRKELESCRWNYVHGEKLIEIFSKKKAA